MIRAIMLTLGCLIFVNAFGVQAVGYPSSDELETDAVDSKLAVQCGMSIRAPRLRNVYGQLLGFGCTGSYKDGNHAGMDMDFQYDPNQNAGGEHVEFDIQGVGIEKKLERAAIAYLREWGRMKSRFYRMGRILVVQIVVRSRK